LANLRITTMIITHNQRAYKRRGERIIVYW
jgi:ABC-type uncharacterized transport system ATPase component